MNGGGMKSGGLQVTGNARKSRVKKRSRDLMLEVRRQIPAIFDATDGAFDRVAQTYDIPPQDVLAEVLRDTRRKLMQIARESMGLSRRVA